MIVDQDRGRRISQRKSTNATVNSKNTTQLTDEIYTTDCFHPLGLLQAFVYPVVYIGGMF